MGREIWIVVAFILVIGIILVLDFATTKEEGSINPFSGFVSNIDYEIKKDKYETCIEENTPSVTCPYEEYGVINCLEQTCSGIEPASFEECFNKDFVDCDNLIRIIQVDCSKKVQECWVNQQVGCLWLPGDGNCGSLPICNEGLPEFCSDYIAGLLEIIETRCALGICKPFKT